MIAVRSSLAGREAFTLAEMMVGVTVLLVLVALVAHLFSSATKVSSISGAHLEADNSARVLFARMAADFSRMVRRLDVDYYLKNAKIEEDGSGGVTLTPLQIGNDQMAFYAEVPGYAATSGDVYGSVSLVAYRLNEQGKNDRPCMERMSKALLISANNATQVPVLFKPAKIDETWATAANANDDVDYETIARNVFRFEYYYLLRDGTVSMQPRLLSSVTISADPMKDVVAIGVVIAVTDRKVAAIITVEELKSLASQLPDFTENLRLRSEGDQENSLAKIWQKRVGNSSLSPQKKGGIYIYERLFYFPAFKK